MIELPIEEMEALYSYNPETGVVHRTSDGYLGYVADGYLRFRHDKTYLLAHRIAYALMNRCWPMAFIDHRNGNRSDNRWSNLRDATKSQNGANRKSSGVSEFLGVTPHGRRWVSSIKEGGKRVYLGVFSREENAALAYNFAALRVHKEFARING